MLLAPFCGTTSLPTIRTNPVLLENYTQLKSIEKIKEYNFGMFSNSDHTLLLKYYLAQQDPTKLLKQLLDPEHGGDSEDLLIYAYMMMKAGKIDELSSLRENKAFQFHFESTCLDEAILNSIDIVYSSENKKWFETNEARLIDDFKDQINLFESCKENLEVISEMNSSSGKSLGDFEKSLLFLNSFDHYFPLLHLEEILNIPEEKMVLLLRHMGQRTSSRRYGLFGTSICALVHSQKHPLETYKLLKKYGHTSYRHELLYPLINLLKRHQSIAIREFEKLTDWPLVEPVGYYPLTINDFTFEFMYQLSKQDPKMALELGGKTLIYPSQGWGGAYVGGLEGIVAAFLESKDNDMQLLIEKIEKLPKGSQVSYFSDVVFFAAAINLDKAKQLADKFTQKFPDEEYSDDLLEYALNGESIQNILSRLDNDATWRTSNIEIRNQRKRDFLTSLLTQLSYKNPHLGYYIAKERGVLDQYKQIKSY